MRWPRTAAVGTICAAAALAVAGCGAGGTGSAAPPASGTTEPVPSGPAGGTDTGSGGDTGTPAPTYTPTPTGTTGTASTAGLARCRTVDLALSLRKPDAGAGQRYLSIVLTNTSRQTCRVYGYGGIQLVNAAGRSVPTKQVRDPSVPPQLVRLTPGASAYSAVHWAAIPSGSEPQSGNCEPVARALRVIPPDEHTALSATWTYGPVCGAGRIDQRGYRAGTGQP